MALAVSLLLLSACADRGEDEARPDHALPLVWVRGDDTEDWDQARAGLWWALSLLGAAPTDEGAVRVERETADRVLYALDLDALGLEEPALEALDAAVAPLLASDERRVFGGVDTGRFLMATVYSPWRYYAITGACDTLDGWRASRLGEATERFAVTDSLLVDGDREITLRPDPGAWTELAWQAAEGEGSLEDGSFEALELEVLDLMANGQQRFAVYGTDGALRPASTATPAGQPGRCMWCHEGNMQVISDGNVDLYGYITLEQFKFQLSASQALTDQIRGAAQSPVRWGDDEVHAYGELLEEHFLSPSAVRLGREWGVTEEEARALVDGLGLPQHESDEYPDLPPLYTRGDVDAALPGLLSTLAELSALDLPSEPGEDFDPVGVLASARELEPEDFDALDGADGGVELASCGP